jgi:hypothetical protein
VVRPPIVVRSAALVAIAVLVAVVAIAVPALSAVVIVAIVRRALLPHRRHNQRLKLHPLNKFPVPEDRTPTLFRKEFESWQCYPAE